MKGKDLISIADLDFADLMHILDNALQMKRGGKDKVFSGEVLGMIFEKPSLRTRVSFDVAMHQLGGHTIYLSGEEVGLGKREPIADVAKVLSGYIDLIMARMSSHNAIKSLAQHALVPVINGLSPVEHPCQAISDLLTIYERKGKLQGLSVAYIGDGNNVAASLFLACALTGINFKFASPPAYQIADEIVKIGKEIAFLKGAQIVFAKSPQEAVSFADVVYTDVWTSMGQEMEHEKRCRDFAGYQVTPELLAQAKPEAILMHPMPIHHDEELAEGLLDHPQSAILNQAENRLHAQKAILLALTGKG